MEIETYWRSILNQDAKTMRNFFHEDARINWYNTNEQFTVDEFIEVNCLYPGTWSGKIEKVFELDNTLLSVVHIKSMENENSFYVTSFMRLKNDKIELLEEYWGENGEAPRWRLDRKIGKKMKE